MKLSEQITEDIKVAMRAKDKVTLEALRAAKTAFTLAKTQGSGTELDDADELKILQKLVKQRTDSAAIYREQGRTDLLEKEEAEVKALEKYLPAKMDEVELKNYLQGVIAKTGAESMKDMGKVMGIASKELAGKADGKAISVLVKQLLA